MWMIHPRIPQALLAAIIRVQSLMKRKQGISSSAVVHYSEGNGDCEYSCVPAVCHLGSSKGLLPVSTINPIQSRPIKIKELVSCIHLFLCVCSEPNKYWVQPTVSNKSIATPGGSWKKRIIILQDSLLKAQKLKRIRESALKNQEWKASVPFYSHCF